MKTRLSVFVILLVIIYGFSVSQGRLLIFPNPTGSHIYIRHIEAVYDARAWSINDSLGSIFLKGTLPAGAEQLGINVASLKNGLYNLNL